MAVVSRLTLTDFRSYASASLEPGPGFVLLSGENGAGKTNLLEAVSMLAPGRGLRGAAYSEMARRAAVNAAAAAGRLGAVDTGTRRLGSAPEPARGPGDRASAAADRLSEWVF